MSEVVTKVEETDRHPHIISDKMLQALQQAEAKHYDQDSLKEIAGLTKGIKINLKNEAAVNEAVAAIEVITASPRAEGTRTAFYDLLESNNASLFHYYKETARIKPDTPAAWN